MRRNLIPILSILITTFFVAPVAASTLSNLRDGGIELIDEVPSFSLTQDGITATLTANVGVLNRTASAFGINIESTSCGFQEDSSQIDDGCSVELNLEDEAVSVAFDQDVILESLKVSAFGSSDLGVVEFDSMSDIAITSTGLHDLGDIYLSAGETFTVGFVAGNGFSFDNFTVSSVPTIPEPSAAMIFLVGLVVTTHRLRRSGVR
jgi:hypothetical protein